MSEFDALFGGFDFKTTVQKYCAQAGWRIADINNQIAVLRFAMPSGRTQTVFITRHETNISFLVLSMFKFDSEEQVPHFLSTLLMKRNANIMIGKWEIFESNGTHTYAVSHSVDMQLMNADFFARVVNIVISECDELENYLIQKLG